MIKDAFHQGIYDNFSPWLSLTAFRLPLTLAPSQSSRRSSFSWDSCTARDIFEIGWFKYMPMKGTPTCSRWSRQSLLLVRGAIPHFQRHPPWCVVCVRGSREVGHPIQVYGFLVARDVYRRTAWTFFCDANGTFSSCSSRMIANDALSTMRTKSRKIK